MAAFPACACRPLTNRNDIGIRSSIRSPCFHTRRTTWWVPLRIDSRIGPSQSGSSSSGRPSPSRRSPGISGPPCAHISGTSTGPHPSRSCERSCRRPPNPLSTGAVDRANRIVPFSSEQLVKAGSPCGPKIYGSPRPLPRSQIRLASRSGWSFKCRERTASIAIAKSNQCR